LLLRIILRRQTGKTTLQDMLVVVLVAGVCRNPLVADAYSIPDGLLVVATILGMSYLVDWASYHYSWIHTLFHTPPVLLIRDGRVLRQNLQKELMTEERLCSQLRLQGLTDPSQVQEAYLEGTGRISVIEKEEFGATSAGRQVRNGGTPGEEPDRPLSEASHCAGERTGPTPCNFRKNPRRMDEMRPRDRYCKRTAIVWLPPETNCHLPFGITYPPRQCPDRGAGFHDNTLALWPDR